MVCAHAKLIPMGNALSARGSQRKPKKYPVSVQPLAALADKASQDELRSTRIPFALGPGLPQTCYVDPTDGSIRNDAVSSVYIHNLRDELSETDSIIEEYRARNLHSPLPFGPSGSRTFPIPLNMCESFVKPNTNPTASQPQFWPGQLLASFVVQERLVLNPGVFNANITSLSSSAPDGISSKSISAGVEKTGINTKTSSVMQLQSAVLAHLYANAVARSISNDNRVMITKKYALPRTDPLGVLSMALNTSGLLDLSGIGVSQITPDIACFQGLTVLCLSRNALESLPESIGLLTGLRSLRLSDNRLTAVPQSIGMLANLKSLYLDRNRLTALPASIKDMRRLRTLNIAFNCVAELPRTIGCLQRLATLEAEHNLLRWLPAEVSLLPNTRRIQLGGNPLLTVADLKHVEKQLSAPSGPGSLLESAGRCIAREDIVLELDQETQQPHALTPSLILTIQSAQFCAFCRGPMFGRYYTRFRIVRRYEQDIPFAHVLCEAHWRDERTRCIALFATLPFTAPKDAVSALRNGSWDNGAAGGESTDIVATKRQNGHRKSRRSKSQTAKSFTSVLNLIKSSIGEQAPHPLMPRYAPVEGRDAYILADTVWAENLVFEDE